MPKTSKEKSENLPPNVYEVPLEGSLGLLALGAEGLQQWRKKRAEWLNQNPPKPLPNEPKS
jgi:hypothetical protein